MLGLALACLLPRQPDPAATERDHRRMMALLGIERLRPGKDGMNPSSPNFANTDESRANPYPNVPNPLVFADGRPVGDAKEWPRRRAEIRALLDREVYGRTPRRTPAVRWRVLERRTEDIGSGGADVEELEGVVDNRSAPRIEVRIRAQLGLPRGGRGRVPVVVQIGWLRGPFAGEGPWTAWKGMLLAKGWGFAVLDAASVQEDSGAGLQRGIIGLCNRGEPRGPEDWGALKAWAWGASRLLDHLRRHPRVDGSCVGIEGLSRFGKAAAVAMAYDERFAIAFVGSSGQAGIKIWRRDFGETVENVASSGEYHWMAGNYLKYAGPLTPGDLPVDGNCLLALCAPRPVFVGVGSPRVEGIWIDPVGTFQAVVSASPVWELLGARGLATTRMPPEGVALTHGDLAFSQHTGGHTNLPNWPVFLEFAERALRKRR
ncbi:MAG: alpha/beta hydrolase family protein [Fimbriimonadaceae bacterium]